MARATLDEPHGIARRLSGWDRVLAALTSVLDAASRRGLTFVIVHFGPLPFPAAPRPNHPPREHRKRAVPVASRTPPGAVGDSRRLEWAFGRDGVTWHGVAADDEVIATGRHDLMIQRIYADLPDELTALYGPWLPGLANLAGGRSAGRPAHAAATVQAWYDPAQFRRTFHRVFLTHLNGADGSAA